MKIVYSIFVSDGRIIVAEGGQSIGISEELARFPVCCYSGSGLIVYLNDGVITEHSIVPLREFILTILKSLMEDGLVRVEFPDWRTMHMYSVDTNVDECSDVEDDEDSGLGERYKNAEDMLDHFLAYQGPNILV